jgi:hypothetical protein
MSFLAALSPEAASKVVVAMAVGALSTAGAGAGAATLLTGSTSPSTWLQAYRHASQCHQAAADQDPDCSVAAAQAIMEKRIAAEIESKAKSLAAQRKKSPPTAPSRPIVDPNPGSVAPVAAPAAPAPHDDSGESDGPDD